MRAKTTKIWWCQSRFRLPSIPLASAPVKDHPASDSKIWGSRAAIPWDRRAGRGLLFSAGLSANENGPV